MAEFSALSYKAEIKVLADCFLNQSLVSSSKLIPVIGKIQVIVVEELRSLPACWLLWSGEDTASSGCSYSLPCGSSHLQWHVESFSHLEYDFMLCFWLVKILLLELT